MTLINGADIWNIIILVGAVQGFILSILVASSRKKNNLSNHLLAALIFLLALACTNLYITESGLDEDYAPIQVLQQLLPFIIIMPVGPLIYLYVRSVTEKDFRIPKKHKWHFASVGIDLFPTLLVWILLIGLVTERIKSESASNWGDFIDSYNTYMDIPRWLSLTVYLLLARQFLLRSDRLRPDATSDHTRVDDQHKWLHQFLNAFLIFQVIWFLFLIPYIIPTTRGALLDNMGYYPIYIPLAILVYWLGFKGYLQTRFQTMVGTATIAEIITPPQVLMSPPVFSQEEIDEHIALLKWVMENDKLYLEPTLQVQTVSTKTGIAPKTISYILNNHLLKSFNEFVNDYRIEEVKKRLLEGGNTHLTIAGIALECGFNSQATFQRAFKNSTGVSPREYISLQSQQSA